LTNPTDSINTPLDPLTSPCSHGASDQPPAGNSCGNAPRGGGSGGGSAKSSVGGLAIAHKPGNVPANTCTIGKLLSSLMGNSKPKTVTTGAVQKTTAPSVTNSGYLLTIVIVGILLVMIAWGRKG
jgi:hypothetical protein